MQLGIVSFIFFLDNFQLCLLICLVWLLCKVLVKIAFDITTVGWKIRNSICLSQVTTCAWLPDTIKSGKNIEKTQPETTRLDGQLVITANGKPNPEKLHYMELCPH